MADVLDYSSGWPAPAAIKAAHYVGVVRYIGTPGRGKNLTRTEAQQMHAAGIPVALVYEDSAGWMQGGAVAGTAAARAAVDDAATCGVGLRCVYFAADFDVTSSAQMTAVERCLDGAAGVLGRPRVGVYGEADVIDACLGTRHATYGWQTRAWSGGRVSGRAHLLQQVGYVFPGGVQCDRSTVLKADWGQWPDPAGGDDDDMPNTPQELKSAAYAAVQQWATERHDTQPSGEHVATLREMLVLFPELSRSLSDMRAEVAALRAEVTELRSAASPDAAVTASAAVPPPRTSDSSAASPAETRTTS